MRIVFFACLCLLFYLVAQAGEVARPQGSNCALEGPPEAAGEAVYHGLILRIYPRARDINSKYTGCQTKWELDGNTWITVSVVVFKNGAPARVWSPDRSLTELMACRYQSGRLVAGSPDHCPAPQFLLAKSVAPGCVEKMQMAVAERGLEAAEPQGCSYE